MRSVLRVSLFLPEYYISTCVVEITSRFAQHLQKLHGSPLLNYLARNTIATVNLFTDTNLKCKI